MIREQIYEISDEMILAGIQRYLENPVNGSFLDFADNALRIDVRYLDDEKMADTIMQYAVFGRIVYVNGVRMET